MWKLIRNTQIWNLMDEKTIYDTYYSHEMCIIAMYLSQPLLTFKYLKFELCRFKGERYVSI